MYLGMNCRGRNADKKAGKEKNRDEMSKKGSEKEKK